MTSPEFNLIQYHEMPRIKDLSPRPEVTFYDSTQRVKTVEFTAVSTVRRTFEQLWQAWDFAIDRYERPLVQARVILPVHQENSLDWAAAEFLEAYDEARGVGINGRIPFQVNHIPYAIYYIQGERGNRPSYYHTSPGDRIYNAQAVYRGLSKRNSGREIPLPPGFQIHALEFVNGSARNILHNTEAPFDEEAVVHELVALHRRTFQTPHDPAQQSEEGVHEILRHNPIVLATNPDHQIVSVGFLERDPRFTFGGIVLVEPTYFTDRNFEGLGLSSMLRRETQELVRQSESIWVYHGAPPLIFNESVRHSSFQLSLANGCHLAGTNNSQISGDLGETYTQIGPATWETGLMPMGLTYFADPRIEVQLPDNQL